ncbi:MAG: sensor histidine kinase [Betaproteobacteria bacterium]
MPSNVHREPAPSLQPHAAEPTHRAAMAQGPSAAVTCPPAAALDRLQEAEPTGATAALATLPVYAGWALSYAVLVVLEVLAMQLPPRASAAAAFEYWTHLVFASAAGWTALAWMHARRPPAWRLVGARTLLAMGLAHLAVSALAVEALRLALHVAVHGVPDAAGFTTVATGWRHRLSGVATFITLPALVLAAWRLRTRRVVQWQQRLAAAAAEQRGARQELIESELLALQAQVEPHFLFNTLAHIRWHYRHDPQHAGSMLERLVHFARDLLPAAQGAAVSMRVELGLVRHYLALLSLRLGPRLRWAIEVPDDLLGAQVPSMGLLTLVENAIQHGIGRLGRGGTVQLLARAEGGRLLIEVLDDGVGLSGGAGANVGLANLRAKLLLMAGDAARFELRNRAGGGARAVIMLPLQREGRAETARPPTLATPQGLPWGLLVAGIGALWAWQLLVTGLMPEGSPADWPRALVEVPLLGASMLPLAALAWRVAPAGQGSMALQGAALLAGALLGVSLSQDLLSSGIPFLPCEGTGGCARGALDAAILVPHAWFCGALLAWAARSRIAHAQTQQRALGLAAQNTELRRHAAAARLRAARARAEPADLARLLQQLQERYDASPMGGEAMLDGLTSYLRRVAETAHCTRVSLNGELEVVRALAALVRASQPGEPGELLSIEIDDRVDRAGQLEPLRLLQPLRQLWAVAPLVLSLHLEACQPGRLQVTLACARVPADADALALEGALATLEVGAARGADGCMHWRLDVEFR